MTESIVIVSAARTPMGGLQGDFVAPRAHDLGARRDQAPPSSAPASRPTASTRC